MKRSLTKLEIEVLLTLEGSLGMWGAEIARKCPSVSESYIYDLIKRLEKWGLVEEDGTHLLGLARPLLKYRLSEKGGKLSKMLQSQRSLFADAA